MASFYVSSVGWSAVASWPASTAVTLGQYYRQLATPAVDSERVWKVTTAGTTGGTEPAWNLTAGTTTTSGTAVFTECTGREAEQLVGNWRAPCARLRFAVATLATANGDHVYVAHDHAETQAAALLVGSAPAAGASTRIICVNSGGSMPPVSADLRTTASVSTTGANNITFRGGQFNDLYVQGVTFHSGSGASATRFVFGDNLAAARITLKDCLLELSNTNGTSFFLLDGGSAPPNDTYLINTPLKFGAAAQGIAPGFGSFYWRDTPNAVQGTAPTSLVYTANPIVNLGSVVEIRGCDLSGATNTIVADQAVGAHSPITVANCKVASGATLYGGTSTRLESGVVRFHNCDDGDNFRFVEAHLRGKIESHTAVYRSSGASDGTTSYSWLLTTASPTIVSPLICPPIARRWNRTGSAVTATVEIVTNKSAAPTDAEIWLEIEALTTSGAPVSTVGSDRVADVLPTTTATAQTASTVAWTAAVRQNSQAYLSGNPISLASNPGRVFFCTTPGTSSGSEPAGYAAAVDGGSVTDGTAVFRAGWRQKLAVSFAPQVEGFVFAIVKVGGAITTAIVVDPKLTIG